MKLHLDREVFKQFINKISIETSIAMDILEKDYYVCCILQELSKKQDELQAFLDCNFKDEFIGKFNNMQDKYIINEKYKIDMKQIENTLQSIKAKFCDIDI